MSIGVKTFGIIEQTARDFNNQNLTLSECVYFYYQRENDFKRKINKNRNDGRDF